MLPFTKKKLKTFSRVAIVSFILKVGFTVWEIVWLFLILFNSYGKPITDSDSNTIAIFWPLIVIDEYLIKPYKNYQAYKRRVKKRMS